MPQDAPTDVPAAVDGWMNRLGPKLRELRKERELTLEAVADRAGLTKGFLSLVERGQTTISVPNLLKVCEILGVSTVAEHVESKDLLSLVMELGCTAGQGFWLERPLEPQDVLHLCGSKVIPLPARNRHAA